MPRAKTLKVEVAWPSENRNPKTSSSEVSEYMISFYTCHCFWTICASQVITIIVFLVHLGVCQCKIQRQAKKMQHVGLVADVLKLFRCVFLFLSGCLPGKTADQRSRVRIERCSSKHRCGLLQCFNREQLDTPPQGTQCQKT